ncbi:hypothetical protein [uncultured Capnocytophaga sp.]|uniref:hypothetical protein n=1 Tax=uncultured Capnocytophaga sp. TaxID=159273 RepID=UPI0026043224|nr:hypothetical protein [uncultured Capnocytophaga sp.]
MLFLEDESHYVRQLMRFPIEELSTYPYLLFDALDRIDASHTRSFYEMAPAYEKLYRDFSYWVCNLISIFPEKEKALEAISEDMLLEITRLTPKQAILIAQAYKEQYPKLKNTITNKTELQLHFDVTGEKAWIVEGEEELFGEIWDFYYVISDATGEVEYTFNHHGTRDPHLREHSYQKKKE